MNRPSLLRIVLTVAGVLCAPVFVSAQAQSRDKSSAPPQISEDHRISLIRGLESEHAFAKITFPQGKKGVTIKDGKVEPGPMEINQLTVREGAAANPGDRVLITDLRFVGNKIVFEFNGGPRKGTKWYQRITLGGGSSEVPVAPSDPRTLTAGGSVITLVFKDYIPDMTLDQAKEYLAPVLDFTSMTVAEAYAKKLPPKVAEAIKNHQVLVGMDRDMVEYTLGRPPKRYRDKDEKGRDYEEWIYGTPPEEVQFVRFIGPTVAQLTVMKVDGEKIVKTEPEVELASKETEAKPAEDTTPSKRTKRPTLMAPGEQRPDEQIPVDPKTGEPQGTPTGAPPQTTPGPQYASHAD